METKTIYHTGWNMPGCLPEEPYVAFDDPVDARDYLLEELERVRDAAINAVAAEVDEEQRGDREHDVTDADDAIRALMAHDSAIAMSFYVVCGAYRYCIEIEHAFLPPEEVGRFAGHSRHTAKKVRRVLKGLHAGLEDPMTKAHGAGEFVVQAVRHRLRRDLDLSLEQAEAIEYAYSAWQLEKLIAAKPHIYNRTRQQWRERYGLERGEASLRRDSMFGVDVTETTPAEFDDVPF